MLYIEPEVTMTTLDIHENGKSLTDLVRLAQEQAEVVLVEGNKPVARVLPIVGQTTGMEEGESRLARAAQALLADYTSDGELTVFTGLDGEPVHA